MPKVNGIHHLAISPAELAAYVRPAAYAGEGGGLAQPPYDPTKPHGAYPPETYRRLLGLSDAEFTRMASQPDPPVAAVRG